MQPTVSPNGILLYRRDRMQGKVGRYAQLEPDTTTAQRAETVEDSKAESRTAEKTATAQSAESKTDGNTLPLLTTYGKSV